MPQEHGSMANQVKEAQGFQCVICETKPTRWTWGDVHGEAMCVTCGTPYQLVSADKKDLPRLNIKESWVPVLQRYWKETGKFTGLAQLVILRDYPECVEGQKAFYAWLDEHKELVPKQ